MRKLQHPPQRGVLGQALGSFCSIPHRELGYRRLFALEGVELDESSTAGAVQLEVEGVEGGRDAGLGAFAAAGGGGTDGGQPAKEVVQHYDDYLGWARVGMLACEIIQALTHRPGYRSRVSRCV